MNITTKGLQTLIVLSMIWALAACAMLAQKNMTPESKLIGEWLGADSTGNTGAFVFREDGTATMVKDDKVVDGDAIGGTLTWQLDDQQDPMHLDLMMSDGSGNTRTLPMIIRFLDDNKLRIRISENKKSRPLGFSQTANRNQMVLTRQ